MNRFQMACSLIDESILILGDVKKNIMNINGNVNTAIYRDEIFQNYVITFFH